MKKYGILAAVLAAAIVLAAFLLTGQEKEQKYKLARVDQGDIVSTVSATGSLSAVVTVQVGTQVSGTIQKLYVDFNSPVKKGQPIAQIDPALFAAQVEQTRGNFLTAEANLEKAKVNVADTLRSLNRNKQLISEGIISQGELDAAQTAYDSAMAGVRAAEAAVIQTQGAYRQAQTNLAYTTIKSPVDGTVVSRSVDVGQTVAASFQTPTLFTIAQDLTKMQIETSVDEADIGQVKIGQKATFAVDAYPEALFTGKVTQIRNAPITTQNVVTYVVVISVDNRELKLMPGMTANVNIEISRKNGVLRIPAAALRFKPKTEGDSERRPPGKRGAEDAKSVFTLSSEGKPVPVSVKTGATDGRFVELVEGNLAVNNEVIVEQIMPKKRSRPPAGGMGGPRF